jgi:hypothetical protein
LVTISIIMAMSGAARTPLTTALTMTYLQRKLMDPNEPK